MKSNGFIATSLIYSFFLALIALITALLTNYIADKTILERYNTELQDGLNSEKYSVTVYSRNSNIQDGMTLTNLVSNGNFAGLNFWTINGSADFHSTTWLGNHAIAKNNNYNTNSYISQNVYLVENNVYYVSVDYIHDNNVTLNTYFENDLSNSISTERNTEWKRGSKKYVASFSGNNRFTIGDSGSNSYIGTSYFSNPLIINLTASFGSGYEPDQEWIDKHIDWFDGTINYIRMIDIESEGNIKIRLSPYVDFNSYNIDCYPKDPLYEYNMTTEIENGKMYGVFTIDKIKSDIKCNVDWSKV